MSTSPLEQPERLQAVLKLRPTVEVLRAGPDQFVVMNGRDGGRFTVSARERQVLHLLDGAHTPESIRREYVERFGDELTSRSLGDFLGQLHSQGLLVGAEAPAAPVIAPPPVVTPPRSDSRASWRRKGRAARPRDPVDKVNRRFDVLAVLLGWALHPACLAVYLALTWVGAMAVADGFDRYVDELRGLFRIIPTWILIPLSLAQTILFMNLPRELAVGVAVRRFGGRVRHFGVFRLGGLLPFFACDPGDSLQRMSPLGRYTVLTAGLFVHLAIGAVGAIGWAMAPRDTGLSIFCLLLILPWVVGTFLHLNPFVRLDGYKILSTITSQPRLQERALAETKAWLGRRRSPEALTSRERFWLRFYGLGWHAWMWCLRVVYIGGGTWWLVSRLQGLGALIALTTVALWYRRPLARSIMKKAPSQSVFRHGGSWPVRWGIRLGILALLAAVAFLPYDRDVGGDCILVAAVQQGVRAQVRDEIVQVHVRHGQEVSKGDLIATLSGRDVNASHAERAAELREAEAQLALLLAGSREEDIRIARDQVEIARGRLEYQDAELRRQEDLFAEEIGTASQVEKARAERQTALNLLESAEEALARTVVGARTEEIEAARARVESARAHLEHAERQKQLLELAAPISGRVVTPNLDLRSGQVAEVGDLIAVILDTTRLRLEIAADEAAAPLVKPGMPVKARLRGLDGSLITATVHSVSSKASDTGEFRADGVRTDREVLFERSAERPADDSYHFRVYAELDNPEEKEGQLLPGMTGYARITVGEDVLWRAVTRPFARYFRTEVWSWLP